jgi:hypothetical protein
MSSHRAFVVEPVSIFNVVMCIGFFPSGYGFRSDIPGDMLHMKDFFFSEG